MVPDPQIHQIDQTQSGGGRNRWAVAAQRFNVLYRVVPATAGRRRTLNFLLLVVVLPLLLLGVALVNFLASTTFSASRITQVDSQPVDLALESVLRQRAQDLASVALDPILLNAVFADEVLDGTSEDGVQREAGNQGELVSQSLDQLWQSHPGFEALALVNTRGEVAATAGILHQDFYRWQNTPAFYDSLNSQGRPSISPLKFNVLSLDEDGNLDLSSSRIERLVFTAGMPQPSTGGRTNSLIVGILKSDTLVDPVEKLLQQEPAGSGIPESRPTISQESADSSDANPNIQLLSETPGEIATASRRPEAQEPTSQEPTSQEPAGRDSPATNGPVLKPADTGLSPFEESGSSWYSALPSLTAQQNGRLLANNFSLVLAAGSILLAITAAWFIIRAPKYAQPRIAAFGNVGPTADNSTVNISVPFTYSEARKASQGLVTAQESVRREMANYLHGHVQSKLVALSLSLGICRSMLTSDPDQASVLLEQVQAELQKVQDEDLRRVSHELYPAIIKMGLVPAMRSLIDRFNESLETSLIIDADVFGLDQTGDAELPEKQWLGVYRIAEEALNNALKHAHATHIEVNLIRNEMGNLVLSVKDDGCGFDPDATFDSPGLAMMADYATAIGGQATIISSPEKGTTVSLAVAMDSSKQLG